MQLIINAGGRVEREYGLGRMRTDLLVVWKHKTGEQRVVIELKIKYDSLKRLFPMDFHKHGGTRTNAARNKGLW